MGLGQQIDVQNLNSHNKWHGKEIKEKEYHEEGVG